MGKRKKMPDDLMGNILSESITAAEEEEEALSGSHESSGAGVSWEERPERVGMTFNLSKQLGAEMERLRQELREEGDAPISKSEIAEMALRIAVEDVMENGAESELSRRLGERRMVEVSGDDGGATTRRSVDESGWIFETTHDENGEIIDEDVVGTVADLPVVDEYMDEHGRLVSVAKDELGNTFEQIMDEDMNTLGARLLPSRDHDANAR